MYRLDPDQTALLQRIESLADEKIAPHAAAVDAESRFPLESVAALAEAGLLGLTVPTEHGGMGQGMRVAVAALDAIGQRCASTGMVYLMHLCGVACYAARPESAGEALKAAARGEHLSTLAWSEKGSRSHFWAPMSQARSVAGGVTLSAQKSWVTSAGVANGYVISARSPESTGPMDTQLFLVDRNAAGMTVAGAWNSLGMRGNASAPMSLQDVSIPTAQALSDPGQGFPRMMEILPWFSLGNAGISTGIAEAAVRSTTDHVTGKGFEHLGTKLADLPNLRERLARMRIQTDKTRAHLSMVLDKLESGAPDAMLGVLSAKASASGAAKEVTDLAMETCGGAAFSRHLSVERNFRDARAASVMAPTTDVLHDFIGKALCGMPLF
ncbi:MAG: acyl-CoA dehydrogenase family protein [Anaerolineae bacterium]|jgi:alkylation response protein AidB-like acyl-CoA dehydrogenase|nr:acyl-CoA/acyl-ACP dehydrogenase [Ardenticatenia bacterium]